MDIRERAGITLDEISARTRIPVHHLEEIERGDVAGLPPGVYAKSWARAYAREIGVEADVVLEAVRPVAASEESIDDIKEARLERDRVTVEAVPLDGSGSDGDTAGLMRKLALVALVLAIFVAAFLYFFPVRESGSSGLQPVGGAGQQAPGR